MRRAGRGLAAGALLLIGALGCLAAAPARAERVDLELILAVDASGSVSQSEYALQLGGIAEAFRAADVQDAILSGPEGRIAVALLIWSDAAFPKVESGWRVLDSRADADRFAGLVAGFVTRRGASLAQSGGGTGIGAAIDHALKMFDLNGHAGARRTIDVSGDGVETLPWYRESVTLPRARAMAEAAGVTVNGLAILSDDRKLGEYYRREMITGPGAFVLTADGFEDFARAIRMKLVAEIQTIIGAAPGGPRLARR